MNRGLFEAQLNQSWTILRDLNIGEERIYEPQFPENPRALFKGLKYSEIWEIIYSEQFYNFRLIDDALLQFRVDAYRPLSVHYTYYECPYEKRVTMEEFEQIHPLSDEYDFTFLSQDYDNYLSTTNKESTTPIRYDYDPDLYHPCTHPASHIHIGHNNSIRVGTKMVLRPLSFILLIIRQVYPDNWVELNRLNYSDELCRNIRETLDTIDRRYWNQHDEKQLYFF